MELGSVSVRSLQGDFLCQGLSSRMPSSLLSIPISLLSLPAPTPQVTHEEEVLKRGLPSIACPGGTFKPHPHGTESREGTTRGRGQGRFCSGDTLAGHSPGMPVHDEHSHWGSQQPFVRSESGGHSGGIWLCCYKALGGKLAHSRDCCGLIRPPPPTLRLKTCIPVQSGL